MATMNDNGENGRSLPDGWEIMTVGEIAENTMIGLDRGRSQQSVEQISDGYAYIKMNNVSMDGSVDLENIVFVPANGSEVVKYSLAHGDILFNTRNSLELVGKTGIVKSPNPNTLYNNNLMRIKVKSFILPEFLCYQMCSYDFRKKLELVKKSTTNVAAIYAKDLLPLPVVLPPLIEQSGHGFAGACSHGVETLQGVSTQGGSHWKIVEWQIGNW